MSGWKTWQTARRSRAFRPRIDHLESRETPSGIAPGAVVAGVGTYDAHRRDLAQVFPPLRQFWVNSFNMFLFSPQGQALLAAHNPYHMINGPGGSNGPGSGLSFLSFHRGFVRQYENWLGALGINSAVPIAAWNPSAPMPLEYQVNGIANGAFSTPTPTWATLDGGITPDPVFGHTRLMQFRSSDELGQAFGAGYHNSVHNGVGGTMASMLTAPQAPIFFNWHAYLDQIWGTWQEYAQAPPAVLVRGAAGDPSATANQRIQLFVRGSDGNLWERDFNGRAWSWTSHNVPIEGQPVVAAVGNTASTDPAAVRTHVFFRGDNGELTERFWTGRTWLTLDHGVRILGEPTVLVTGNTASTDPTAVRIHVFAQGTDGSLIERYWTGRAWLTLNHGLRITTTPTVLTLGDTHSTDPTKMQILLFAQGADGTLVERQWTGLGWQTVPHGIAIDGTPTALALGDTSVSNGHTAPGLKIHVWVRGADGNLVERYFDGSKWITAPTNVGIVGQPTVLQTGDPSGPASGVRIHLFFQGTDGNLWERYWGGQGWANINYQRQTDGAPAVVAYGNLKSTNPADIRINLYVRALQYDTMTMPMPGTGTMMSYQMPRDRLMVFGFNGAGWNWSDTGVDVVNNPTALALGQTSSPNPQGVRSYVYVERNDGQLMELYGAGSRSFTFTTGQLMAV